MFILFSRLYVFYQEDDFTKNIAPNEGQFISIGTKSVYIQVFGKEKAQPLLLIHGTAAWSGLWKETALILAKKGYRVHALDLAPFGFSDRPDIPSYNRQFHAKRIVLLLKKLGLENTILIGHSFGSGAAVEAVMQNETMFSGLILIDAALSLKSTYDNNSLPLFLQNNFMRELLVSSTITNPLLTKFLLQKLLYRQDVSLEKYVNILQKPMHVKGTTSAIAQWLPSLLLDDNSSMSAKRDNYREIGIPVKLIWGDKDSITPLSQAHDLHSLIPNASLRTISEVGHIPQIENPKVFQKILLESIEGIRVKNRKGVANLHAVGFDPLL